MSTALPIGITPPRRIRRSLIWLVLLPALWIALLYWQPLIQKSGVPTTLHQLATHGLIALGLWLGLEKIELTQTQRRAIWLTVMIPDTLWFTLMWSAAINGVFHTAALPVLPLAIFLPVIVVTPLLLMSTRVGQVLDAMPATWLVALQTYRAFGSWAIAAALRGAIPSVFGLPAGIGDLLTGVLAVLAAIAVAGGTVQGRKAAIAWNVVGLVDFVIAITLGLLTSPGRFQLIVSNVPSIGVGAYPDVLTPAFVVPSSILLHILSLRQLVRQSKREMARSKTT